MRDIEFSLGKDVPRNPVFKGQNDQSLYILRCLQTPEEIIVKYFSMGTFWLSDLCLELMKVPEKTPLTYRSPNEQIDIWERLSPFIRAIGACWLEVSTPFRDISWRVGLNPSHRNNEDSAKIEQLQQYLDDLRYMNGTLKNLFRDPLNKHTVCEDFDHIVNRFESVYQVFRERLNYGASMASLEESKLGIKQNERMKQLTQIALVFIPMSLVTSVFGMNIDLLGAPGAKWWTVFVGAAVVYVLLIPLWFFTDNSQEANREKLWNWSPFGKD
jgi:hypothetical protein